jgi:catechol 2,3-dioxygenase-like lactoylglutathione lyase family enzyme
MAKTRIMPGRTNTILYCRAWPETIRFYQEQLALPVVFANDWFVEFQLTDSAFLSIADATRASISAVEGQGITLAWQVTHLGQIRDELERQGIPTTPIRRKWNASVFYCHDPEGHRLEFWTDLEAGVEL